MSRLHPAFAGGIWVGPMSQKVRSWASGLVLVVPLVLLAISLVQPQTFGPLSPAAEPCPHCGSPIRVSVVETGERQGVPFEHVHKRCLQQAGVPCSWGEAVFVDKW
jgi:hypothetical protein